MIRYKWSFFMYKKIHFIIWFNANGTHQQFQVLSPFWVTQGIWCYHPVFRRYWMLWATHNRHRDGLVPFFWSATTCIFKYESIHTFFAFKFVKVNLEKRIGCTNYPRCIFIYYLVVVWFKATIFLNPFSLLFILGDNRIRSA